MTSAHARTINRARVRVCFALMPRGRTIRNVRYCSTMIFRCLRGAALLWSISTRILKYARLLRIAKTPIDNYTTLSLSAERSH